MSAVNANQSDMNDIELHGETDDEDMVDGETGYDDGSAPVRNIRDPGQPTVNEHREHMTTRRPADHGCVMGRGVSSPHKRLDAQDDLEGVLHKSIDWFPRREGIRRTGDSSAGGHTRKETQNGVGDPGSERRN